MKLTFISIIIAIIFIGGSIVFKNKNDSKAGRANNVTIIDGKQIIDLQAKGGYSPRRSIAKAGMPTILIVDTSGTFDCSSAIRIPSLNISRNLPSSGTTEIDLGNPRVGILKGMCSMGMYPFEINFQN